MTDEHKMALAQGREASRAVRAYLEALQDRKPRRGRRRTAESISARLAKIEVELGSASAIRRLNLIQERIDLSAELAGLESGGEADFSELEAGFVKHALSYANSKGISYAAWRELDVPAATLRSAGISR